MRITIALNLPSAYAARASRHVASTVSYRPVAPVRDRSQGGEGRGRPLATGTPSHDRIAEAGGRHRPAVVLVTVEGSSFGVNRARARISDALVTSIRDRPPPGTMAAVETARTAGAVSGGAIRERRTAGSPQESDDNKPATTAVPAGHGEDERRRDRDTAPSAARRDLPASVGRGVVGQAVTSHVGGAPP
ncbi:hypothetical protein ABT218_10215 [Streptomyces sp. NPDC001455]|uniref:hypothetical protein n=1 Tax=unclassified Streptomyces TaxID=2593676 RepID=UPI0033198F1C